jgi:DNA-binding response OmpR family regulator
LPKLGKVAAALDGERAWTLYEERDFGLVIADWVLPGMDGPELCRRIRGKTRPKYTYVMVLSALRGGRVSYLEAMDSGADEFVTKPVGKEELAARIRVAERMQRLRREVQTLRGLLPLCS